MIDREARRRIFERRIGRLLIALTYASVVLLLIGVVLALVMTWGVIRLFATEPPELLRNPAPALNGSAGVAVEAIEDRADLRAVKRALALWIGVGAHGAGVYARSAGGRRTPTGRSPRWSMRCRPRC